MATAQNLNWLRLKRVRSARLHLVCGVLLIALTGAAGAACQRETTVETGEKRAMDVARYAVGAVAEGSLDDVSDLFGRQVGRDELERLQQVVPPSESADPKHYEAEILAMNQSASRATVCVTSDEPQQSSGPFRVELDWDHNREREVWVNGEYKETVLGDWSVGSIAREAQGE